MDPRPRTAAVGWIAWQGRRGAISGGLFALGTTRRQPLGARNSPTACSPPRLCTPATLPRGKRLPYLGLRPIFRRMWQRTFVLKV
jgi:hypothetical protein